MKTPREVLLSRHREIEPKLERMWSRIAARPAVAPYHLLATLWRELIWPCRRVWAGLACAWVLIAVLDFASREPATCVATQPTPRSAEEMRALVEQRRLLAQLIEPAGETSSPREAVAPGPRSEKSPQSLKA